MPIYLTWQLMRQYVITSYIVLHYKDFNQFKQSGSYFNRTESNENIIEYLNTNFDHCIPTTDVLRKGQLSNKSAANNNNYLNNFGSHSKGTLKASGGWRFLYQRANVDQSKLTASQTFMNWQVALWQGVDLWQGSKSLSDGQSNSI